MTSPMKCNYLHDSFRLQRKRSDMRSVQNLFEIAKRTVYPSLPHAVLYRYAGGRRLREPGGITGSDRRRFSQKSNRIGSDQVAITQLVQRFRSSNHIERQGGAKARL